MTSDHRALSNVTLNLYLYPVGAWAIALGLLYFTSHGALAIPLCYPLAIWQIALSAWWGRRLLARLDRGELSLAEAHAGVRSVGQLLAWSALCPAFVFMTDDPLAPSAWSAALGAVGVSGLAYLGVMALTRIGSRWTHGAAIAIACAALPLNATGAVTIASMLGLFDAMVERAPLPGQSDTTAPASPSPASPASPVSPSAPPKGSGAGRPPKDAPKPSRSDSDRDP